MELQVTFGAKVFELHSYMGFQKSHGKFVL